MRRHPKQLLWIGLTVLTTLVVYSQVLVELFRDWLHDPNYSHGFLIPVISGFFLWKDRRSLRELPRRPANVGLLGVLAAAALFVLGSAAAEVFTQRISLILLAGSVLLFCCGWQVLRAVAFPLALLLLAIPLPYLIYYNLTGPLQAIAAKFAIAGLHLVGVPAVAEGNIIHLAESNLEVAEACSGIRSLYAFLALGAIMAQSMPVPTAGRVAIFLLTIPLSVAGNSVRVWGSGMGAHLVGLQATRGTIHELFGLVVFVVSLGVFLLIRKGARGLWESAP